MVGTTLVAKSPPDGYTLLMTTSGTLVSAPLLARTPPFHPLTDFTPITVTFQAVSTLVVNTALPIRSVKELIDFARQHPGKLGFASAGVGTNQHIDGETLKTLAGIDMVHVPYKGSAAALTDLIGGQVSVMFDNLPAAMPHIKSGKLRALAVTGAKRTPLLPELPTVAEGGVAGFAFDNWWGILVPAGTPKAVITRINVEIVKAMQTSDVKERFANLGVEAIYSTPTAFDDYIKAEHAKLAKIIKASGARAD